jgi:hypothetical protein
MKTKKPEEYNAASSELSQAELSDIRSKLNGGEDLRDILNKQYKNKLITIQRTPESFRECPFTLRASFRIQQSAEHGITNYPLSFIPSQNPDGEFNYFRVSIDMLEKGKIRDKIYGSLSKQNIARVYRSLEESLR